LRSNEKKHLKILVACEESQTVCKAFRKKGHETYSCDILPESGGHPEWHIQGDVLEILNKGWDMIIAHPPCTYLTVSGNRWFNVEKYGDKAIDRIKKREEGDTHILNHICLPPYIAVNGVNHSYSAVMSDYRYLKKYYFAYQTVTCRRFDDMKTFIESNRCCLILSDGQYMFDTLCVYSVDFSKKEFKVVALFVVERNYLKEFIYDLQFSRIDPKRVKYLISADYQKGKTLINKYLNEMKSAMRHVGIEVQYTTGLTNEFYDTTIFDISDNVNEVVVNLPKDDITAILNNYLNES